MKTKSIKLNAESPLGNWLPGSETPDYLVNMTASYGFDPLKLGSVPADLKRFQEAELIHCRWAMLGVAGAIAVEALGFGNWYDVPLAAEQTYFGVKVPLDLNSLVSLHNMQPLVKLHLLISEIILRILYTSMYP